MRTKSRYDFTVIRLTDGQVLGVFRQPSSALKLACKHTGIIDVLVKYHSPHDVHTATQFGWADPKMEHWDKMMDYTRKMMALLVTRANERHNSQAAQ